MVKFLNRLLKYQNKHLNQICCAIFLSIFLLTIPQNIYGNETSNSEIKASWISTIIDWLNWRDPSKSKQTIICTIGRDKVYMYLKRMELMDKKFLVHNKSTGDDFRECNILYVSDSEQEYYMNILQKADSSKGIIAISSIEGFARHGGSIEFVIRKKASLIINLTSVKKAKVVIDEDLSGWVETIY